MDSSPGRPGSLADRGLLPFSSGSCLGSAWWRSLREGYCHDLGLLLLSLSLTLLYTHSHTHTPNTHMHTDTYTSLSPPPVCYFNQRSRYFAVPPVLTHLISPSILLFVALCRIIVYHALYVFSCFFIVLRSCTLSCLAWRC